MPINKRQKLVLIVMHARWILTVLIQNRKHIWPAVIANILLMLTQVAAHIHWRDKPIHYCICVSEHIRICAIKDGFGNCCCALLQLSMEIFLGV